MYLWIVFLRVACVLAFLLAHGVAAGVILQLRNEPEPERMKALLDLSGHPARTMYISLHLTVLMGITLGFMGSRWG